MTGRRRWSRFSIRFGLILISIFAVTLAINSYFQAKGQLRARAAASLMEVGVTPLKTTETVSFQDFTFTGTEGNAMKISLPSISKSATGKVEELARRFLGGKVFDDYGTIVVHESIGEQRELFLNQLEDLPAIKTVFYYPNTIDGNLIQELKKTKRDIRLEEVEGDVPRDANGNSTIWR